MKKLPIASIITVIALLVVFAFYAFSYQVRFSQTAVKVQFGQADGATTDPGVYFRWPWPVVSIQSYDKRLRTLDTPEGETKTRDGKNLVIGCYAVWKIEDPLKFYKVFTQEARAETQLRARINEARQLVVGRHDMADFFGLDEQQITASHDKIETELLDAVAPQLKKEYGIAMSMVAIRRISLPEGATQEVFKSMTAEREKIAATYRAEGESLATSIESTARSAADQIREFAKRKATEIESEGRRAATSYLAQIENQNRDFFIFLRRLETIESMLKQNSTIFFDTNNEFIRSFAAPLGIPLPAPQAKEPRTSSDGEN